MKKKFDRFGGKFQVVIQEENEWGDVSEYVDEIYITKVVYNNPAVIVFWNDGTKTVSKCGGNDEYNPEMGFALCFLKKTVGGGEVKAALSDWVSTDFNINFDNTVVTLADVRRLHKERYD